MALRSMSCFLPIWKVLLKACVFIIVAPVKQAVLYRSPSMERWNQVYIIWGLGFQTGTFFVGWVEKSNPAEWPSFRKDNCIEEPPRTASLGWHNIDSLLVNQDTEGTFFEEKAGLFPTARSLL